MEENERKAIFTNTLVSNEETDRQSLRSTRVVRRLLLILFGAGLLCNFVYWIIQLIRWAAYYQEPIYTQETFWICIVGFAMSGYVVVHEIFAPRIFARKEKKRVMEAYGTTEITIKTAFFDDALERRILASGAKWRLPYTTLKRITETKDLFLLRTQQKLLIELSKLGFDGTDAAGFRRFMDEKCPNAKRRWKKEKTA
jgi:hypothetical protein